MITPRHRDCRDRLTHENVIRISLLPNRLEERLLNEFMQRFRSVPLSLPAGFCVSLSVCLSDPRDPASHEVGRLLSRLGNCHKGSTDPNVIAD